MRTFLLREGSDDAFELWNRDSVRNGVGTAGGTLDEKRNCQSRPGIPLFMVCVYNFEEFVKPMIFQEERFQRMENYYSQRPLEVATYYGHYDTMVTLYERAFAASKCSIRSDKWLEAAAECGNLDVWSFVVDHASGQISQRAIVRAVEHPILGTAMLEKVLGNVIELDAETLDGLLKRCSSLVTLEMVLNRHTVTKKSNMTNAMLKAAVQNPFINPDLTNLILSEGQYLRVTDLCFVLAIWGPYPPSSTSTSKAGVVKKLLSHHLRAEVSEEVVCKVGQHSSTHDVHCLEQLIEHCPIEGISEDMLLAAATNVYGDDATILRFLSDHPRGIKISRQVVHWTLPSWRYNSIVLLLSRFDCPQVLEESLYTMIESPSQDGKLPLVMPYCKPLVVTDAYIEACAAGRHAWEVEYVINLPRAIPISRRALYASITNDHSAAQVLSLLLRDMDGCELELREDILVQALSHSSDARDMVRILANHWGALPVTEQAIMAAVKNGRGSTEVLDHLLKHMKSEAIMFTDNVLIAAIEGDNIDFCGLLLAPQSRL